MIKIPREELPDVDKVRTWALQNLPKYYVLTSVDCVYGSDELSLSPDDFELRIDYENHIAEGLRGSNIDMEAHHNWKDPLTDKIRAEWSPWTLRIAFIARATKHKPQENA